MNGRVASGKALGFAAFAVGGWMYSVVTAGWYGMEALGSPVWSSVTLFATVALVLAALAAFLRGDGWHAAFFGFWAAVFWGAQAGSQADAPGAFGAWYFLGIALFSLLLWLGSLKASGTSSRAGLVALGVGLAFVGWALHAWGLGTVFAAIGGYVGMITAVVSFWVAADELDAFAGMGGGGSGAPAEGGGGAAAGSGGGSEF